MPSPEITVGLPVHNGGDLIARSIRSVLAQTFRDFELIIVDNASTDRTADVATAAVKRDDRVRYTRQATNVGAAANFNHALWLARGTYFCWLAHDDWFDSRYLDRCHEVLRRDPALVLCSTWMGVVDHSGAVFREQQERLLGLEVTDPARRFHRIMWSLDDPTAPVFGLIRTSVLRELGGIPAVPQPDRHLLYALALRGGMKSIPERLFFHFGPPGHLSHYGTGAMRRRSWDWLHAPGSNKPRLALGRSLLHRLGLVAGAQLPLVQKVWLSVDVCLATIARRGQSKWRRLVRRLGHGAALGTRRPNVEPGRSL